MNIKLVEKEDPVSFDDKVILKLEKIPFAQIEGKKIEITYHYFVTYRIPSGEFKKDIFTKEFDSPAERITAYDRLVILFREQEDDMLFHKVEKQAFMGKEAEYHYWTTKRST